MTLDALYTTILARKSADPDSSWTAQLLAKGPEKCAEKFGEEAIEAIIEAVKDDKAALTSEAADVLYHLLVMLAARDVPLADVMATLEARQSTPSQNRPCVIHRTAVGIRSWDSGFAPRPNLDPALFVRLGGARRRSASK